MSSLALVVEYLPSPLRLIAGNAPEAGTTVILQDPWQNTSDIVAGSKPEWGEAGFEFLAPHFAPGYLIRFEGANNGWVFEHKDGITRLSWRNVEPPPPEPPPPPPPEPDQILVKAGYRYSARLEGEMLHWTEGEWPDEVYFFIGLYSHVGTQFFLPVKERLTAQIVLNWVSELRYRVDCLERALRERWGS